MKKLKIVPYITFLLLFTCCEKDVNTFNFTENITVGLAETFNSNRQKTFLLRIAPSQNCHCMDKGELIYTYFKLGNSFNVNLLEIQIPKGCNDKYGMPYADIDLGSLSKGSYNIQVNTKSNFNSAFLTITDTAYRVTMKIKENVDLVWGHYRRVFDNSLWGGFCYNSTSELNKGLSLIDSLISMGAQPTSLKDGDYFFFSLLNGKPDLSMSTYVPHYFMGKEINFIFDYNADDERIKNLMARYKYTDGDLYIKVQTGKGFVNYNWR